jgi:hypothetical protein
MQEDGALNNKQERINRADDMMGTCNAILENNSQKEVSPTFKFA